MFYKVWKSYTILNTKIIFLLFSYNNRPRFQSTTFYVLSKFLVNRSMLMVFIFIYMRLQWILVLLMSFMNQKCVLYFSSKTRDTAAYVWKGNRLAYGLKNVSIILFINDFGHKWLSRDNLLKLSFCPIIL